MTAHDGTGTVVRGRAAALMPVLLGIAAILLVGALFAVFGDQTPVPDWRIAPDPAGMLPF
jgi:hypothetical protein